MRYRPMGEIGTAVSAITLTLDDAVAATGAENIDKLLDTALDEGVNSFFIESLDPTLIRCVGSALNNVDRDLLSISLLLGPLPNGERNFSPEGLNAVIAAVCNATGLTFFDTIILDDPQESELPSISLKTLRSDARVKRLGIRGSSEVMDIYIKSGRFDVLYTPSHIHVNAQQRSCLRAAREQEMIVFSTDYFPETLLAKPEPVLAAPQKGLFGMKKKPVLQEVSNPYEFLYATSGWEAEDLCLAHALLDPGLAGVVVRASTQERLQRLSKTCERDMPVSMPAQLEMARVAALRAA